MTQLVVISVRVLKRMQEKAPSKQVRFYQKMDKKVICLYVLEVNKIWDYHKSAAKRLALSQTYSEVDTRGDACSL